MLRLCLRASPHFFGSVLLSIFIHFLTINNSLHCSISFRLSFANVCPLASVMSFKENVNITDEEICVKLRKCQLFARFPFSAQMDTVHSIALFSSSNSSRPSSFITPVYRSSATYFTSILRVSRRCYLYLHCDFLLFGESSFP